MIFSSKSVKGWPRSAAECPVLRQDGARCLKGSSQDQGTWVLTAFLATKNTTCFEKIITLRQRRVPDSRNTVRIIEQTAEWICVAATGCVSNP